MKNENIFDNLSDIIAIKKNLSLGYFSTEEVWKFLSVTWHTIRRYIKEWKLKWTKRWARNLYIEKNELIRFLKENKNSELEHFLEQIENKSFN